MDHNKRSKIKIKKKNISPLPKTESKVKKKIKISSNRKETDIPKVKKEEEKSKGKSKSKSKSKSKKIILFSLLVVLLPIIGFVLYLSLASDKEKLVSEDEIEEVKQMTVWDVFLQKMNEENLNRETIH